MAGCFAGLGYLSFYLAGKMSLFDKRGYSSRVFFVLLPLLVSILIAVSRVDDYQHRWVDIIAAAILGESF
jgi:membrane-associated phospholipid phosphatase